MSKVIAPFFFLVVSVGLFFTYIDPAYKQMQALRALDGRLENALTRSKELTEVREALLQRYSSIADADLARLKKLLPDSVDNVRLIIDIDNVASRYGMRVKNFSFPRSVDSTVGGSEEVSEGPIGVAEITFITSGTYADFSAFLIDLERSLRLLDVRSVIVTASTDVTKAVGTPAATSPGAHQFNVSLQTYWLR